MAVYALSVATIIIGRVRLQGGRRCTSVNACGHATADRLDQALPLPTWGLAVVGDHAL